MRVGDVYISSIGVYLPPVYDADRIAAEGICDPAVLAKSDLVGVPVAGEMPAPEMALHAARQALARSTVDPLEIDLILYPSVFHQGPDGWGPASYIQHHAVGGDALAIEVRDQCSGMFAALHLAASHLRGADEHKAVLIVGADNFAPPLVDRWSHVNGMIFGDAAAAVILTKRPGFARLLSVDTLAIPRLEEMSRSGVTLFPPPAVTGRPMDLSCRAAHFSHNSPFAAEMMEVMIAAQHDLIKRTVANSGVEINEITLIGHMNASRDIITRNLDLYGLPLSRSTYEIGRDLGHIGVNDQIVCLERLMRARRLSPGDRYLMAGVGPGVHFTTAVVEVVEEWGPA